MVPEGWTKTTLGKHVRIHSGFAPASLELSDDGNVPYVKVEDMNNCSRIQLTSRESALHAGRVLPVNTVIFPKRGAAILNNKVRITGAEIILDTNMMGLEALDTLDPWFAYYRLVFEQLFKIADTSTIPQINNKHINPYRLPLPPLPEQRKIADILSTWDAAIEKTEALLATACTQKRALMQSLLTGRRRFPEFEDQPWRRVRIGDIASEVSQRNKGDADYTVISCTKTIGFVNSLDYFKKKVFSDDLTGYKVIRRNQIGYPSNHVEEGSIGIQNLYDAALVSPIYTVFETGPEVEPMFLYRVLKTDRYRQIFAAATNASVDRRGSLRWKAFATIKIALPSLPEQTRINEALGSADDEIESLEQAAVKLRTEKKSLMQQLLTGKRRVVV